MGNCLVTKFKSSINNELIPRIGEISIGFEQSTQNVVCLHIGSRKNTTLRIVGNGYFTDKNGETNLGKTKVLNANIEEDVYMNNSKFDLFIDNKYNIYSFSNNKADTYPVIKDNMSFDIEAFKYSNLQNLILQNSSIAGNLSVIGNSTAMNRLYAYLCPNIYGDTASLSKITDIKRVNLLQSPNIDSKLEDFSNKVQLVELAGIKSGNLSALKSLNLLEQISVYDNVTGDLAKVPNSVYYFNSNGNKNITWSSRDTKGFIIAINNVYFSNIDDVLINEAQCVAKGNSFNTIVLIGTRTSASDAAVSTLQSKGYTVSITPA